MESIGPFSLKQENGRPDKLLHTTRSTIMELSTRLFRPNFFFIPRITTQRRRIVVETRSHLMNSESFVNKWSLYTQFAVTSIVWLRTIMLILNLNTEDSRVMVPFVTILFGHKHNEAVSYWVCDVSHRSWERLDLPYL